MSEQEKDVVIQEAPFDLLALKAKINSGLYRLSDADTIHLIDLLRECKDAFKAIDKRTKDLGGDKRVGDLIKDILEKIIG